MLILRALQYGPAHGHQIGKHLQYYRLTEMDKKQLVVEQSPWKQMAEAVARAMRPAAEES